MPTDYTDGGTYLNVELKNGGTYLMSTNCEDMLETALTEFASSRDAQFNKLLRFETHSGAEMYLLVSEIIGFSISTSAIRERRWLRDRAIDDHQKRVLPFSAD